jgi:hypothetical protein
MRLQVFGHPKIAKRILEARADPSVTGEEKEGENTKPVVAGFLESSSTKNCQR